MISSARVATGALLGGALFLSACGTGGDEVAPETVTQTVDATTEATTAEEAAPATPAESGQGSEQAEAEDPVFAALDAALAAYAGAVVVDVDREDDRDTYDVDVVVDGQVVELEVDGSGSVREDEREGDDDDVRKAGAATVTAADAIRQALDRHPEGVLDEIELDEDDGTLRWEVELDDADRRDLAELVIPAN